MIKWDRVAFFNADALNSAIEINIIRNSYNGIIQERTHKEGQEGSGPPAQRKKRGKKKLGLPNPKKKKDFFNDYIYIYLFIYLFISRVVTHSFKNLGPLFFNQSSSTSNYPTQKLNKNKILKQKIKNSSQSSIRVLTLGFLNGKYLVFKTPNTKNTIVRDILNAILKQQK